MRLALLLALLLTGCAETSHGDAPQGCLDVSDGVADTIAEGGRAQLGAAPRTLNPRSVAARNIDGTYVIAIYMLGPGGVEETGLWTADNIEGDAGQIHSVDAVAQELTYWPPSALTPGDPGVGLTRECV